MNERLLPHLNLSMLLRFTTHLSDESIASLSAVCACPCFFHSLECWLSITLQRFCDERGRSYRYCSLLPVINTAWSLRVNHFLNGLTSFLFSTQTVVRLLLFIADLFWNYRNNFMFIFLAYTATGFKHPFHRPFILIDSHPLIPHHLVCSKHFFSSLISDVFCCLSHVLL